MIGKMAAVAVESVKRPTTKAVWSERRDCYVCPEEPDGRAALAEQRTEHVEGKPAPLNPRFKLVFLTAAFGTLFFFVVCVGVHLAMGSTMSPPLIQLIDRTFDLVKIGFGAVVGLLGAKAL
jgi:hypothetical protein